MGMGEVAAVNTRRTLRSRLACAMAVAAWFPVLCLMWPQRPYLIDLIAQVAWPVSIATTVLGAVLLAMRHWRSGAAVLAAAAAVFTLWMVAAAGGIPQAPRSREHLARIRVVTYNAHSNISAGDDAFGLWLVQQDADVVCVVDPPTNFPDESAIIREAYPFAAAPQYGLDWPVIMLSRTPIESIELVPYAEPTKFSLPARRTLQLTTEGGAQVLFTAMYPRSPRKYGYWKQSVASVAVDAEVVRRWLTARPSGSPPLIIAGDFNTTPTGRTHSIMRTSGLKPWSPVLHAGTFPAWLPSWIALPLDRVWVSPEVSVGEARIGPRFKSDHRPVAVDLYVPKN